MRNDRIHQARNDARDEQIRQENLRKILTTIDAIVTKYKILEDVHGSKDKKRVKKVAKVKKVKVKNLNLGKIKDNRKNVEKVVEACAALKAEIDELANRLRVPMMLIRVNFDMLPDPVDPVLFNDRNHNVRLKALRAKTQLWANLLRDPTLPWVA